MTILKDLMKEVSNYAYPALLLAILLCLAFILVREQGLRDKIRELWRTSRAVFFFFYYLAFLLMAAVFGRSTTVPLKSVFQHLFFKAGNAAWNKEILENILIFVPLTFMMLLSFPRTPHKPFRDAFLFGLGTSVFIELSQLIFWLGEFQFSDIIYNTLGGVLGYLLWAGFEKLKAALKEK